MNAVVEATGLGKRYRRRWALADCTLAIPAGRVVGLVGPNGAGKTTLLQLAAGLLAPTAGMITVLGKRPGEPGQLRAVGFVAQDTPTYAGLSVAGHLRMGSWLNPGWDDELAGRRIRQLGLDLRQRAGALSGGQRAQLALTLAVAKRPELLLLDEPVASLDPLARREFLQGRVRVAGETEALLASHHRLSGPRRDPRSYPANWDVIEESHTDKQSVLLVRTDEAILDPAWTVKPVSLEDLVLAYMSQPNDAARTGRPRLEVAS